jgi:hypothetical protein
MEGAGCNGLGGHDPNSVDVTKATTMLYASDRNVFLFAVDDTNPASKAAMRNGHGD